MSNDPNDYAQERYEQEVIDEYLKELAEGPAHGQMATFGKRLKKNRVDCWSCAITMRTKVLTAILRLETWELSVLRRCSLRSLFLFLIG
jgi:hypothetical protein